LRNQQTPLARVIVIAERLPNHVVRDILSHSQLAPNIKSYLAGQLQRREQKKKARAAGPGSVSTSN
jgi:hypothetical protein